MVISQAKNIYKYRDRTSDNLKLVRLNLATSQEPYLKDVINSLQWDLTNFVCLKLIMFNIAPWLKSLTFQSSKPALGIPQEQATIIDI